VDQLLAGFGSFEALFFFLSLRLVGNRLYSQVKFKNKTNRRLAPGIIDGK
jgi:hypothetical protein